MVTSRAAITTMAGRRIRLSKEGKTTLKLKVERLKKERTEKEDAYADTGGSMKKKRKF